MGNPICPGCKHKISNKMDINLEGISGGVMEHGIDVFVCYCSNCGYPIPCFTKASTVAPKKTP